MLSSNSSIIALDVGGQRIGVASANAVARIASPLQTIINNAVVTDTLRELLRRTDAAVLVVGLPRGLDGQHTAQTRTIEDFVLKLKQSVELPVYWQDEAVTSKQAEAELQARGKPYAKEDIDALAATYILEDFLRDHPEIKA